MDNFRWANFRIYSLGNHTDGIVGCFFEDGSYDITTISRNGQTCIWECTIDPKDLVPLDKAPPRKKKKVSGNSKMLKYLTKIFFFSESF